MNKAERQKRLLELLNSLDEVKSQIDLKRADKQGEIDMVMTKEIRDAIGLINSYYDEELEPLLELVDGIAKEIKLLGAQVGKTVKGDFFQAVYTKPKVGKPSISIRQVGGK